MFIKRTQVFAAFALLTLLALSSPPAQQAQTQKKHPTHAASRLSDAQKIELAMSAGPTEIARHATIIDLTEDMSKPKPLREGTNGWACYAMVGQPMCLDKEWQKWAVAWMSKGEVNTERTGIAYMLKGDAGASNINPYDTKPTADNQWVVSPAHIMLIYKDPQMLDAFPTDPKNGGPWVMWKGTPYAHVMVPVSPTQAAVMSK